MFTVPGSGMVLAPWWEEAGFWWGPNLAVGSSQLPAPSRLCMRREHKSFWVLLKVWQRPLNRERLMEPTLCQESEWAHPWACMKPREKRSHKVPQEEEGAIWPAERLAEPWEGAEPPELG